MLELLGGQARGTVEAYTGASQRPRMENPWTPLHSKNSCRLATFVTGHVSGGTETGEQSDRQNRETDRQTDRQRG